VSDEAGVDERFTPASQADILSRAVNYLLTRQRQGARRKQR
jgi:hypothetical protein